jgi:hypothetical protein
MKSKPKITGSVSLNLNWTGSDMFRVSVPDYWCQHLPYLHIWSIMWSPHSQFAATFKCRTQRCMVARTGLTMDKGIKKRITYGGGPAMWPLLYLSTTGQKGLHSVEASVPGIKEIILATALVFLTGHGMIIRDQYCTIRTKVRKYY